MERDEGGTEVFTPDNRAEEQRYVQELGPRNAEARTLVREYGLIMSSLGDHLRDASARMRRMRAEGLSDTQAYDELRREISAQHEKVSELHRRLGEVADGLTGASADVVAQAKEMRASLEGEFERIEDFFQQILGEHDVWLKEHAPQAEELHYGRRATDFGEFRERMMPIEQYDEEVMKLQELIAALESQVTLFIKKHRLTADVAEDLLRQIDDVHERLQDLDEKTDDAAKSRERRSLMQMMDPLRRRITEERAKITPPTVAAARAKYGFVKESYASVAHMLTEPQRREMRSYLARLTGLVNDLETQHHITLVVANAAKTAPEISAAVLRQSPKPRTGFLHAIGDVMKLRP